jgi:hypothetical protein
MRHIKQNNSIWTLTIVLILVTSCSPTKEEKIIMDFEQNIGGTKTDLSMKIKSLEPAGVVKAADSVLIYDEKIKNGTERMITFYKNRLSQSLSSIQTYTLLKDKEEVARLKRLMQSDTLSIKNFENGEIEKTEYADWYATNKIYKANPDSVLLTKYKCTYTIKNPLLNNVEQELTKLYYISNSGKIVLSEKL